MSDAKMQSVETGQQEKSITHLRSILNPGDTVYTILNHVSRSGMSRRISLVVGSGKEISNITWHAAQALCEPIKVRGQYVQDSGIAVGGCGMDMGFELVYRLSHVLFPDGFGCIGNGCPASDHSNGDRNYTPHSVADHMHKGDSGYALKQRWL